MTYCDEHEAVYIGNWPFYLRTPTPTASPRGRRPQPLPVPDRLAVDPVRRRDVGQGAA